MRYDRNRAQRADPGVFAIFLTIANNQWIEWKKWCITFIALSLT